MINTEHIFNKFATLYSFKFKIKLIDNIEYKNYFRNLRLNLTWDKITTFPMNESLRNNPHCGIDNTPYL